MAILNKLTLAFFLGTLLLGNAQAESLSAAAVGSLTKLEGGAFKPEKKKILLYFWATWCPDCKEKIANVFPKWPLPADTQLVTVNTDKQIDRAHHYVSKEKMPFTVVRDEAKSISSALKVFSVPFWAVVAQDTKGAWNIVDSQAGGDIDKMKAALAKK